MIYFLDTSAVIKLLIREDGTDEMERLFGGVGDADILISSEVLRLELHRIGVREAIPRRDVEDILSRISVVPLDDRILQAAIDIDLHIRSLDAIFVATCLELVRNPYASMFADQVTMVTRDDNMKKVTALLSAKVLFA